MSEPNPRRTRWFKAVTTTLTGPHYGGLLYLPGSIHKLGVHEPFDSTPNGWCTAGLYVASHRRVAARWGPVVVEVYKPPEAPIVKTTKRHKPTHVPHGVDSGTYAKYRTNEIHIMRIVGISVYDSMPSPFGGSLEREQRKVLGQLNDTLEHHGKCPVELTGVSLERLRDDRFNLWEVHDPNAVLTPKATPRRFRHRVEVEFEADHQLTEADIYSHLGRLDGVHAGSQRIVGMR